LRGNFPHLLKEKATTEWFLLTIMPLSAKVTWPRRGHYQTSPPAVFSPLVGAPDIAVTLFRCV
jgi:hypothetical protein